MTTDLERRLRDTLAERRRDAVAPSTAPEEILRRARRRARGTVVVSTVTALAMVAVAVVGVQAILDSERGRPGGDGAIEPLPSQGPAPGETSLTLDSGVVDGEPWTLRITRGPSGYGLSFDYERLGGGGSDFSPMRGDRVFGGVSYSTSPTFPGHDPTQPPLPFAFPGQVRSDVAQVVFELEPLASQSPLVAEASLYEVPEELVGPTKVMLLWVPGDTLLVAGQLTAYDDDGNELGTEYLDASPLSLFPKVLEESPPDAVAVMKQLQLAGAVVGRYHALHGSFSGLDPTTASAIYPAAAFNTSAVAAPGEVSLRVSGPQDLVLASATADGLIYSACFVGGPSVATYGRNDTSDPYACTNGWLNPDASPPPSPQGAIASGSDPNGNLWSLALIPMGNEFELEYLIGPIGTYIPIEPLIPGLYLCSIGAAAPDDVPVDAPALPGLATSIYGLASAEVAGIELVTSDGETFEGSLHPLPDPIPEALVDATQAFVIHADVPQGLDGFDKLIAYDAEGGVLVRVSAPRA